MQLHTLKPKTERKSSKYIGRGGKRGTTAGRGTKGQKARAGHKIRPEIRDIIKKLPKLRGYRFKSTAKKVFVFDFNFIKKYFHANDLITPDILRKKNFLPQSVRPGYKVKILSGGDLNFKLRFKGIAVSNSAKAKILNAGGSIN